jgi:hypothetical protein
MRALLLGLLALAVPLTASAQENVAAASDAFSRAQEAELRGEWELAAELYALADRLAPTPEALRSAAIAAQHAGLNATAATHAEALIMRAPNDRQSRAIADEILSAHASSLARIEARCAIECRVLLDGRVVIDRAATQHIFYARPGERRISASYEGGRTSAEQTVTLVAAETGRFTLEPSTDATPIIPEDGPPPPPPRSGSGISPGFFVGGLVLTVTAGALLIWSGVEVLDAHSTYDPAGADAQIRYEAGRELETRTNVIIGVTAGLAVITVLLAVFTDWGGGGNAEERAGDEGGRLSLGVDQHSFAIGWTQPIQ